MPGLVFGLVEIVQLFEGGSSECIQEGHVIGPLIGDGRLQPLEPASQHTQDVDVPVKPRDTHSTCVKLLNMEWAKANKHRL